jgi:hypothetical protein
LGREELGREEFGLDFLFDVVDDERVFVFEEFRSGKDFASDLGFLV